MSLSSHGLYANNRDSISFQVKACKHAFIGISSAEPNSTNMYEIVIGAFTNTRTILALSTNMGGGSYARDVTTSSILDCNAWKTFYLSWAGSDIIFGQVTDLTTMDYNQVFSYNHGSPYTKNYLLVSGYGDATVDFRFFVDCGPPPPLGNATVTCSSTLVGGTTTYACIIGWTPANSDTITCQNNGAWSEIQYTCTIVDCGDPPTIAHSTWNGTTTYASVANYTCDIGYFDVNGTEMVTCQADGTWTATDFGCQIKDCGIPNSIEFGNYTMIRSTYQGNVTYYCDIGYYSEGNESIECLHTGNWSETDFICIIVDCFDPPFVDNCDITNTTTTYLSVVNYTCHIGYLPQEGPDTITCQANGNWTDMTFWCKIIDCGLPDDIDHATYNNGSTTFWKNLTYTCDIGYVPHGLENITCMLNGNWSETDYNCPPFDCLEPAELKDSVVTAPNTTYLYMANYTCDLGHYDSDPGNMSITCTPTAWENITFWCIPVDCYPPTYELPRSTASWDTTIFRTINSSTVQYTCDIGFTIDPEEYADGLVECNYTGLWEEVEFDCIFNCQMYLLNDTMYTVDCCGVISGWEFKPITTGFIYLMVWRKNDAGMPVMVAYNTVLIANTTSIVNVTITDDEKIAVMAFDQIGWYAWEASPIAYEDCNPFEEPKCPQQNLYYQGIEVIPADYQFDWDALGNTLSNRSYAIKYYFTRNTPLQFMSEEYNISIPDHWLGDQPIMTFSIVGVDHAEAVTYTLEPLGDTPQTIYFYIHSYFGTVKVSQKLPNSNETNQFVYNVTAVDGCENYAYTILTVNTFNAPPMFENLPNKMEVYDKETRGNQKLYDIVVRDPTDDPVCCTLQETYPSSQNFLLEVNGTAAKVLTTKNAYFSASFVNSYFVKFCCQDRNYSTSAILQVKVRGDYIVEVIPFPEYLLNNIRNDKDLKLWKHKSKNVINIFWQSKREIENQNKTSLNLLKLQRNSCKMPHLIWCSSRDSPKATKKAIIKAQIATNTYMLQSIKNKHNQQNAHMHCRLFGNGDEDRKHFILHCPSLTDIRNPYIKNLTELLSSQIGSENANRFTLNDEALLQLFVDCTENEFSSRKNKNLQIQRAVEGLARNLIYALHCERSKKIRALS
ncbi:hypothetical protein FSP39_005761 [Pinctada imbricata]|uniref:CSMD n=1 Tax=Pinctada imbricata TaxID=66713 RepID=A0AA88YT53_PINIB|nr:hypothetical protein FSP39_005761 [Pinctada imbricata]